MLSIIYKLLVATCFSVFFMTTVFAATPLSTVDVALNGQAPEQLTPTLVTGLTKVMIRLTGNPQIAEQQAVVPLLKDPNVFLERYQQQDMPARLTIEFDQAAITQALNKAGIATWTEQKPTILVWWVTSQQDSRDLLGDSQTNSDIIQQAASQQGFRLRLPLADLSEQSITDKAIFDAAKPDAIIQASTKYNPNAILAVSANHTSDSWQLSWRLWQANSPQLLAKGEATGNNLAEAANNLLSAINPPLAKIYVIKAQESQKLTITIKGVDFSSYVQISNLMDSFKGRLLETNGSVVRYEVMADPTQLKAQLELIHFYAQSKAEQKDQTTDELVFSPQ